MPQECDYCKRPAVILAQPADKALPVAAWLVCWEHAAEPFRALGAAPADD